MPGTRHDPRTAREAVHTLAETLWERLAVARVDTQVDVYGEPRVIVQLAHPPTRSDAVDLITGLGGIAVHGIEDKGGRSVAWVDIAVTWHAQILILSVFHTGDDPDGGGR